MLCLKLSSVYLQYVNERAAHLKIDRVSCRCHLGRSNPLISPVVGWFSIIGVKTSPALGGHKSNIGTKNENFIILLL